LMLMLVRVLFLPLAIAVIVESTVALLADGFRTRYILPVVLINTATNPLLNLIVFLTGFFFLGENPALVTLLLESVVVLVEWRLLLLLGGQGRVKMLLLSFTMNLCSFLAGLVLL